MKTPFEKIDINSRAEVIDWERIENFDPEEFDDPEEPGSWVHMDPLTILKMQDIRRKTGWRMVTHNKYGLRGCVCVKPEGHSDDSRHYVENECDAGDWHFDTDADPRIQAMIVLQSGFTGIGIYYDWEWPVDGAQGRSRVLPIGFHTDRRKRPQVWKRENGKYIYLLK
jgi:hypothetical protein